MELLLLLLPHALSSRRFVLIIRLDQGPRLGMTSVIPPRPYIPYWSAQTKSSISSYFTEFGQNNDRGQSILTDGPFDLLTSVCTVFAGEMRSADMTGRIPEENRIAACPLNGGLKGRRGGVTGGLGRGTAFQIITSTAGVCYT